LQGKITGKNERQQCKKYHHTRKVEKPIVAKMTLGRIPRAMALVRMMMVLAHCGIVSRPFCLDRPTLAKM
jgi:hypothetical protein